MKLPNSFYYNLSLEQEITSFYSFRNYKIWEKVSLKLNNKFDYQVIV